MDTGHLMACLKEAASVSQHHGQHPQKRRLPLAVRGDKRPSQQEQGRVCGWPVGLSQA